ncbi:WXG100 family type VII secretion target [Microbacterium gorillae]|uniref:WXG100 family type VII secretion target n=1 Tax=Microbacterium gorillae TaxID=1231063 RepID=UPI003D960FA7
MEIRGDFQALNSEGNRLDRIADDVDTGLTRVIRHVRELLTGGWSGAAASEFETAFGHWEQAATKASSDLHALAQAVRATAGDMAAAEQGHMDRVRQTGAALDAGGDTHRGSTPPTFGFGRLMGDS